MSVLRPLPARPSLEFDRKEAKALLRRLRAADSASHARARAQHPAIDGAAPASIVLADAQHVVAREYGFASWPRLVQYYAGVLRQEARLDGLQAPEVYHDAVRWVLREHSERNGWGGRKLAAYVPRFYGMRVEDVFASPVTEDDARLAVARSNGFPSWEVLLEHAAARPPLRRDDWGENPLRRAGRAMQAGDLPALRHVVDAHTELLHPSALDSGRGATLLNTAIDYEQRIGWDAMRPIMEWLSQHGQDLQHELNVRLCGRGLHMPPDYVRRLLDRGANASWVAPNGIPVLEHALLRYWNGEAVDLVAARTVPRKALWIAAGLGDLDGVRRFLDPQGRPTPAARAYRPPFDAIGVLRVPMLPDADDEEVLMEAFTVALFNGRTAVMEYFVSRGFNVNTRPWGVPSIWLAVSNAWVAGAECLVRCGADVDLRGPEQGQSARELAREMLVNGPDEKRYEQLARLCRLDVDAILAERDATPRPVPEIDPKVQHALDLARDDAFRLGQPTVRTENLLFGLLRFGELPLIYFTIVSGMDGERFHAEALERVRPGREQVEPAPRSLPIDADAEAVIHAATAIAVKLRRETVTTLHVLSALTRDEQGIAARLLVRFGSSTAKLDAELDRRL